MSATLSYDLKKGLSVLTKEHRWDVLTVLILHANIRNRCWVSTDTICEMATNGNRNKAIAAKKWLEKHKTLEIVTYNKRVDEEKKLKPRQHVYQLLGKIQQCDDVLCDCQELKNTVMYLYTESIDGETFKSIDGETFKSIDGETRSIPIRSQPIEVNTTRKRLTPSIEDAKALIQAWVDGSGIPDMGNHLTLDSNIKHAKKMLKGENPITPDEMKEYTAYLVSKKKDLNFCFIPGNIEFWRSTKTKPAEPTPAPTPESIPSSPIHKIDKDFQAWVEQQKAAS